MSHRIPLAALLLAALLVTMLLVAWFAVHGGGEMLQSGPPRIGDRDLGWQ